MKNSKFAKRILGVLLTTAIIISTCVIPGMFSANAQSYIFDKTYDFSTNSTIQYGNIYLTDSNGVDRQISRAHFSQSGTGELKINNTLKLTGASTSSFLFNDEDGLFELMPNLAYEVSFRIKVVSGQTTFSKNGVTYPVSSQRTELKLAYGMPATNLTNKIAPDTEVGLIAKIDNNATQFSSNLTGTESKYNVGEWYTFTLNFRTPESFGTNGNVLGFALKSFNGIEILIDDVEISSKPTITVDANGGKISKTTFEHKIGDPVNIETPTRSFGYAFEGWFYDKECTREFTDTVITAENANVHLYAGWSDTHFSFEGYTPSDVKYGFGNYFLSIIDSDDAQDGSQILEYHYTSEYYDKIYSGSVEEGNVVYYTSRRTQRENSFSLKKVKANTSYVITFKYKVPAGMGECYVYPATGAANIWVPNTYIEYLDTRMIFNDDEPDVWKEGRLALTTGDLERVNGSDSNVLYIRLVPLANVDTLFYIDDVYVQEVVGDTSVTLDASDGIFSDGTKVKKQNITVGDSLSLLEPPIKADYDFGGWYYDKNLKEPVKTDKVDGTVYLNTLYAGWTSNMGFEGYYYDLNSPDRNNYISDTVSITNENVKTGFYSAKVENKNSANRNVIALNPINNKTNYLVTFDYKVENLTNDVKVSFATMNYNINNSQDVRLYDASYTITKEDAGKGYLCGAVVIETDFRNNLSNRLVMLVQSDTASDYMIYFDDVEISFMDENNGYVLLIDEATGEHDVIIGPLGEEVKPIEKSQKTAKFLGYYKDRALSDLYTGGYKYTLNAQMLYANWTIGEGFEAYESFDSNITVIQDKLDKANKYLAVTGSITEKIADCVSGKRYGVEISYSLNSATGDVLLSVGSQSYNIGVAEAGTGWHKAVFDVAANSNALYLSITPSANVKIDIDDVIVYEITDNMTKVDFVQKSGYGQNHIRIGVKGLTIDMPHNPSHATDMFYGWYIDSALTKFSAHKTYPDSDITVYAKWARNPVTIVNFDDITSDVFTENNSNTASLNSSTKYASSKNSLMLDRRADGNYETYAPLANKDGYVKLESNTTYAVSFFYFYPAQTSSAYVNFNFTVSGADKYENPVTVGKQYKAKYATRWTVAYTFISTGELTEGNNYLYLNVVNTSSNVVSNVLYMESLVITRIDEGRNHVFAYDEKNNRLAEIDGDYGAEIQYPDWNTNQYEVTGWYYELECDNLYVENVHKEELYTELFCRWEAADLNFDNYSQEDSNSKYTVGDDISLSREEAYDTERSLKYSYNYAIKYFETSNNAVSLFRVNDKSLYKLSFRYKLTEAQSDVDIKFLTAHINNRWSFITDYEEATYRIYSGEIGDGWKQATVYLYTKFVNLGTSGLFMTFNPLVEGPTTLYIDAVSIDYLGTDKSVVAFLDENNNSGSYAEVTAGEKVTAPQAPQTQFSSFEGWYTDKELTIPYTAENTTAGITYVYGKYSYGNENFDSYTFKSNSEKNYSKNNRVENGALTYTADEKADALSGILRLGKIEDNTSYKITFEYKAEGQVNNIKFATADELDINENLTQYLDDGNIVKITADGKEHSAKAYITSSFAYTVPKDKYVNERENKNAHYGDMLYVVFDAQQGKITIDNIKIEKVEALYEKGASVLTEQASEEAGEQAMRFYFGYQAENLVQMEIGGESFTLVERGIIFKNARNTATGTVTEKGITVSGITIANAKSKGHIVKGKTYGFGSYWEYDSKEEQIVYSGYITDYDIGDTRLTAARGYIKVKDEKGEIYTFYSSDKKTYVKENSDRFAEKTDKRIHTFGEDPWVYYTIVNPKLMPYIYGEQIENLIEYANKTHGFDIQRVTEKAEETTYEIVIGDTKREASSLVEVTEEDKYVIAMIGTKLIIKGGSDLATMQGVKDFIDYLKYKDSLKCGAYIYDGFVKEGYVSKTGDDYALTFNDEFEGSTLNFNYWGAYNNQSMNSYNEGDTCLGGIGYTRAPGDPGFTTADGLVVKDGIFVRDGNCVLPCARINDTDFVTARMSTFWNMIYQYGMFEISVKVPEPPSHSGWWMNGAATGQSSFIKLFGRESRGCMTEYDLLENFGIYNFYAANIHYWWSSTGIRDGGHSSLDGVSAADDRNDYYVPDSDENDMYDNYHIYTFLWNDDNIVFALDGKKFYTFNNDTTYYDRMPNYIILAAGLGGKFYGANYDPEIHKSYYENLIDYVRVYQIENMGSQMIWAKR
ncbi:MAG: InlB B-repeat-containing protein [Acutalibacteraceae bacterium]|nr:InlB B-repeat-containing protein [Acutalibacteraceae bacterium]